jgi:hypothetical protein
MRVTGGVLFSDESRSGNVAAVDLGIQRLKPRSEPGAYGMPEGMSCIRIVLPAGYRRGAPK